MAKEFCSTTDQIQKLITRGMVIEDHAETMSLLEYGNYFVIINGYKELFIDKTYIGSDERYQTGTSFHEIYAMYVFDRKLRALYLQNILELEVTICACIMEAISKYANPGC